MSRPASEPSTGEFYRSKRVLVTGHTGFKGSWLALWLRQLGAKVYGYSLAPPTVPSLFEQAGVRQRLASHVQADLRDYDALRRAMSDARPDIVFHLAAQSLVRRSYRQPRETYETNVMGTVNLLEAVRSVESVRVCVCVTSDKCYENREWLYPCREVDPMGGADPYSSSKGCAELVVAAYRKSFFPIESIEKHGASISSARAGNVIGGGDWAEDRIVPDCVRALQRGEPALVRTPGAVRPWQHVLEPLAGYMALARAQWEQPSRYAEGWNFGPYSSNEATVGRLADLVVSNWGSGRWVSGAGSSAPLASATALCSAPPPASAGEDTAGTSTTSPAPPLAATSGRRLPMPEASGTSGPGPAASMRSAGTLKEATFLTLDIHKATSLLPWRPIYPLERAVERTIDWYKAVRAESAAAETTCLQQIREYEQAAADRLEERS